MYIQKFVKNWTEPKEKAIVKLPAEAFSQSAPKPKPTIKIRAVVEKKKKSKIKYE